MNEFTLQTELWLPRPRDEVFAFFADARNLEDLTPPWLKFEVLSPAPIAMRPGTLLGAAAGAGRIPARFCDGLHDAAALRRQIHRWAA